MSSRITIHHSCCGEVPSETGCRCASHGGYLVHTDGSILKLPEQFVKPAGAANRTINIILVGYFNSSSSRINSMDRRQFYSLTELLRLYLYSGEELFRQSLYHHRFCPGYRFPREELEWCLWNMLA